MPARPLQVVKIGGSLVREATRLRAVLSHLAALRESACAVVPGGGPFADAVRDVQGQVGFDDRLAHRLALDGMATMSEIFQAIEPRLELVQEIADLAATLQTGRSALWSPIGLRAGRSDIPESWDVTSDSLALWLATELGAARCVLVKSDDAPSDADVHMLARAGFVDAAFPGFAAKYWGAIVVQGPNREVELSQRPHPRGAAA